MLIGSSHEGGTSWSLDLLRDAASPACIGIGSRFESQHQIIVSGGVLAVLWGNGEPESIAAPSGRGRMDNGINPRLQPTAETFCVRDDRAGAIGAPISLSTGTVLGV